MVMTLLGLSMLIFAALVLGWLLRASGVPAGALIGGLLAGLLLGPSVLGRVAPDMFAASYQGGMSEQMELNTMLVIEREAAMDPNITAPSADQIAALRTQRDEARWSYQQPLRFATALLVALLLLATLADMRGKADARHGWAAPVSIGMWAALLPGGLLLILLYSLLGYELDAALLAASAIAIGPWAMTPDDRHAADDAEFGGAFMMHLSARVATLIALTVLTVTLVRTNDPMLVLWFAPLYVLPLTWLLRACDHVFILDRARHWLLPIIGGMVMLRIDLLEAVTFWALLLGVVLSGDGRWIGAVLGALMPGGRRAMRTMRLVVGAMAAGPTQLAVIALAAWTWTLPAELLLALAVGAMVMEISAPLRRMTVQRLVEAEQEFEEIMRDDRHDENDK